MKSNGRNFITINTQIRASNIFIIVNTIAVLLIFRLSDLIALIDSIKPTINRIKLIGNIISVKGTITIKANDSGPSVGISRFK